MKIKDQKRIREIEKQIDEAILNLPIYNINRDRALRLVASIYESFEMSLGLTIFLSNDNPNVISDAQKKSQTMIYALSTAVEHLMRKCPTTDGEVMSAQPIIDSCIELLDKANMYRYVEENFKGIRPGILVPTLIEDTSDNIVIDFQPADEKIDKYEIINQLLIEENSKLFRDRMNIIQNVLLKRYPKLTTKKLTESFYSQLAKCQVDLLFNFPNELHLAGYKVSEIKQVWFQLLYKAYIKGHENRNRCWPILYRDGELLEEQLPDLLFISTEEFSYMKRDVVESLLDDLTYGNMKGSQRFGSLITEPIIKLTDGSRFVSPTFVVHNLAGRNVNATLNRIYAGRVNKDTVVKEEFYVQEIEAIMKLFPTLKGGGPTQLPGSLPDVDYSIYDPKSMTLLALEMKWITEPVTAQEIVSRDEDLAKGLHQQLNGYETGITADLDLFMKNSFGQNYPVQHIDYLVLTKVSIGSGKIHNDTNQIINVRMLKKALYDADENLYKAIEFIKSGRYLPQENVHYKKILNEYSFAGVNFITHGKQVLEPFSLQTPDDFETFPGKII